MIVKLLTEHHLEFLSLKVCGIEDELKMRTRAWDQSDIYYCPSQMCTFPILSVLLFPLIVYANLITLFSSRKKTTTHFRY